MDLFCAHCYRRQARRVAKKFRKDPGFVLAWAFAGAVLALYLAAIVMFAVTAGPP